MRFSLKIAAMTVGMLVPASALMAQSPAQPGGSTRLPSSSGQSMPSMIQSPLFRMNDVAQTMKMTPEQIQRLNTVDERLRGVYTTRFDELKRLNPKERAAREQELMSAYTKDWNSAATGILNKDQFSRYQQLELQRGGFNSLMSPTVQQQLNLTDQQIKQLRLDAQWSQEQLNQIQQKAQKSPQQTRDLYSQYLREQTTRLNKLLTPEQQQQWQKLTGDPYEFAPPFNAPRK